MFKDLLKSINDYLWPKPKSFEENLFIEISKKVRSMLKEIDYANFRLRATLTEKKSSLEVSVLSPRHGYVYVGRLEYYKHRVGDPVNLPIDVVPNPYHTNASQSHYDIADPDFIANAASGLVQIVVTSHPYILATAVEDSLNKTIQL